MWETTREDGSRKLKSNAVPNIFNLTKQKSVRKPPMQENTSSPKRMRVDDSGTSAENMSTCIIGNLEYEGASTRQKQHIEKSELMYKKAVLRAKKLQDEVRSLKRKVNALTRQNKVLLENQKILRKMFNE